MSRILPGEGPPLLTIFVLAYALSGVRGSLRTGSILLTPIASFLTVSRCVRRAAL
jgi:hypothetical protein